MAILPRIETPATGSGGVLCIDFIWTDHPQVTCMRCGRRVSNIYAAKHALVDRDEDGCGVYFKYVTTRVANAGYQQMVADTRPELTYSHVGQTYG